MSHISYSALKIFNECPHKYKLLYEDKVKEFNGTEHTAFGTALHESAEVKVQDKSADEIQIFLNKFDEEIKKLAKELDPKLINEMKEQGTKLAPMIIPALNENFKDYKFLAAEEEIYEEIKKFDLTNSFKGFIDLIVQTPDGKIHIIDWKTCAWGWDAEKKSDPIINYQLTFYKHFYCQKHGIDPKNVETYFALLKRTAKKNNVEIFRVTSGPRKTDNAFNFLKNALYNINNKNFPKIKLNCTYCEFKKTSHCP